MLKVIWAQNNKLVAYLPAESAVELLPPTESANMKESAKPTPSKNKNSSPKWKLRSSKNLNISHLEYKKRQNGKFSLNSYKMQ
jgi:hypothetical protein